VCDEALFDTLRQLRKQLADTRGVPSYIVFSDVSLRQMARFYPQNDSEFSRISGVGDKKLREFGAGFMEAIATHLRSHPRQMFADDSFAAPVVPMRSKLTMTVAESLGLCRAGRSVEEIARRRGLSAETILGHLATAIEAGEAVELDRVLNHEALGEIAAVFKRHGFGNLSGAVESLGGRYSHGQLRVYRAAAQSTPGR
jgi:ATP-dependent DNA helicase RecQ